MKIKHYKLLNIKHDFDRTNTQFYLDFLTKHGLDFIIGSKDVISPQNYRQHEQSERFEKDFMHLYTLGWFRDIFALNARLLSFSFENISINFSIPSIDEMKEEYEEDDNRLFRKRSKIEKFTKEELLELIKNTYRSIVITADISICLNSDKVGYLIFLKNS